MKLLFFDIDGTILSEGEHRFIPTSTMKAIKALQEQGHLCFINTGRSWSEINDDIQELGFDGFVCGCGTYISCHNEILLDEELTQELADEIISDLDKCHLEWVLEGTQSIHYSTLPYTTHIGDFYKEYHTLFPDACTDLPPGTRGIIFSKFCVCIRPDSDLERFRHKYEDRLTFIDRGDGFYEIVPNGYSKASGIQFLMDHYQVALEDTIAIGDSNNDLPMLEFAGLSIGMGVCDDIVRHTVDYVTDTVENDGIYKALMHFHLIS